MDVHVSRGAARRTARGRLLRVRAGRSGHAGRVACVAGPVPKLPISGVLDYYDGPRKGIADFEGQPHLYECLFNDAKDNYSDSFLLKPLDEESFWVALKGF